MVNVSVSSHCGKNCISSQILFLVFAACRRTLVIGPDVPGTQDPRLSKPEEGTTVERISQQAAKLSSTWQTDPRWKDTERTYTAEDVVRLRGTIQEIGRASCRERV